jgi:hypothetical protein
VPPDATTRAEPDTQFVTPVPLGATRAKSTESVPVIVTPLALIVSGPVPELVRTVVNCALVVFINWPANVMEVGKNETPGCVPFPERVMTCVAGLELSVTVIVAVRLPVAVGVNVAATLQLALAARVPTVRQSRPLKGVASAKSPLFVPPKRTVEMLSEAFPVFVKVTDC